MLSDFQDASIHQLFESQVQQTPDAIAVVFEDVETRHVASLTYQELNRRANQLAHHLLAQGVGPEVLVGICVERSSEMVVGILGILKAGGAYVPLDPAYPLERLAFMLEDAQVSVLLTQSRVLGCLPEQQARVICLDTDWEVIAQQSQENSVSGVKPDNLAYVIYTSGSTGRPKGVLVTHRGLCNLAEAQIRIFNVQPDSGVLQFSSLSFDASIWEIVMAMIAGARLYLGTRDSLLPGPSLIKLLRDFAIATVTLPPSVLATLPAEELTTLQTIIVAGEACSPDLVDRWASDRRFFNAYGPTESTVCATVTECTDGSQKPPIGYPILNTQVYLLDAHLQPVPGGDPGEIYIGGVGLARGYLNRPDLTAQRFIPNPFSDKPGERLYKTGDKARYLPDGNIEFLGRIDQQVKIRGFRIELGEIEAALWQHPDVREAVVIVQEDVPGDKRLVAYIVSNLMPDRTPFKSACLAEFDGNRTIEVTTEDISIGGVCLVGVPANWERGKQIRLRLLLPGVPDSRWLLGSVAWREGKQAGIQFDLKPTEQALLQQSVEHLLETQGFMKVLQRTVTRNLRSFLKQKLPDYMVPSSFVMLNALPLTPNGKVDRRALPTPNRTRYELEEDFVAPRTLVEEAIAGIWAEVLRLEKVGVYDNFWELGGHSLLATQVISRVRDTFAVLLPLRSLFEASTVAELAKNLETASRVVSTLHPTSRLQSTPIQPVWRNQNLPLSFAQQQLWFLSQLEPDTPVYNEPITFRLNGPLNIDALEKALNEIIKRHEILRTTFATVDGEPVQVIREQQPMTLPVVNLQALTLSQREAQAKELATEEARRPFDLNSGPLLRTTLMQLSETDYRLYLTLHHIVVDGISLYNVFLPELAALYAAFSSGKPSSLPELPIQYADFAYWERRSLHAEVRSSQLDYWKQQLADLPILQLPTDRPRPAVQTFRGAKQYLALPKTLAEALKNLSRKEGVTLFTTLLAAFKTLLYRYARQDDIVVSTVTAGRNRPELENLIGYFLNTLVLRTDFSGNPSFRQLLEQVQEVALAAYAHQDLPFEQLVKELQPERNLSLNPLFQVMFILEPSLLALDSGWTLSQLDVDTGSAKLDLTLELEERPEGIVGRLEYNTDLFDAGTISRMIGHFQTLLEGIVANPEQRLCDLPLLTPAEEQQLVAWNNTQQDYPQNVCIHQLFEAQVERTPDAVAVVFEDVRTSFATSLSYKELNHRANQLAHHLRTLGVGPEVLVGICVERSLEMMVGLLGILKAGGAYIPLDPAYPLERLAFMLEDAQVPVLLTQSQLVGALPEHGASVVCLDNNPYALESEGNLDLEVRADNLAYAIYTSGSTGKPKGVQIIHRAVVNFLHSMRQQIGLTDQDRLLSVTTLSFDIAALELFLPLSVGARVMLVSREVTSDGAQLLARLTNFGITAMQATPATWRLLLEAGWQGSNQVKILCGGEALPRELANQLYKRGKSVWNLYGPTEATIWSAIYKLTSQDGPVSIGEAIANTQFYVLDSHWQLVPIGVPGELYIGGAGLARGYINRHATTAERFIPNPFSEEPGDRLYKTGDLVRYLPDGNLEFLGRIDQQVKIRGFRIELGEIEAVLGQHSAVQTPVVIAREDAGVKQLVAYFVSNQEPAPSIRELRRFLQQHLPDYMVPSTFVILDTLPLTPNGKVDRRALPAPDRDRPKLEAAFVAPRTPVEEQMASIWTNVLGVEKIGIRDRFFELGGNSLRAAHVIAYVRETFQVELPVRCIFEKPTIEGLAQTIEKVYREGLSALTTVIDLKAEAVLDPEIRPQGTLVENISDPRHIFITGATGFLGAFLVHELLNQTQAQIYCLVRSPNPQQGLNRLQKTLEKYLIWQPSLSSRIIPVPGDLSQPLLGLSGEQFDKLAAQIDTIYHSGAQVNFVKPYSLIKAENVLGTQEVLRLACRGKLKNVNHISTTSVFEAIGYFTGVKTIGEEEDISVSEKHLYMGYSRSKWVAEKLVKIAESRGLPVSIFRSGFILGHSQTGVTNTKDYMSRFIKGVIQIGSYPDLPELKEEFITVDYASKAIVHISRKKESLGKTFHIVYPKPAYFVKFMEMVRSYGYPMKKLSYEQWKDQLIEHTRYSQENPMYPLVPFQTEKLSPAQLTIPELYERNPFYDCRNTLKGLEGSSIVCPTLDAKLLATHLSYFINSGFLEPPPSGSELRSSITKEAV